ncbi:TetR/AcrR family transcriptional regulator [Ruegeria sp. 2012CJ41-6]|uniref:TetR/AcrR family transcriptional regulator n=1 Tax=Ruegeria spongiae TaxID=2942209 RepID=A0ABT0PYE0_9RHOB|nr:TetR/AcrR family transcriptional regulator [Ruegeria spongiae]MCL6282588.1 TetR/AcrR family transcriptional regulator [Ruegeria spongiae]
MARTLPRREPVRAPIQKRSQKRVELILNAAKKLAQEKGTAGIKMGDIAKTAGVTMGSIYQYFPNKRAIVAELATAYLDDNTRKNQEILSDRPNSLAELSRTTVKLVNQYYDLGRKDPVASDIWLGYATDKELQTIDANDTLRNRDAVFAASKHLFREEAYDRANRALLLIISLGGAAVATALQHDEEEGRRILDDAIEMLLAAWDVSILPLGHDT